MINLKFKSKTSIILFLKKLRKLLIFLLLTLEYLYYNFRYNGVFSLTSVGYRYFFHTYNFTWRNERCVEVPVVYYHIKNSKNKNILEIGNVLQNYYDFKHTIVDKYEEGTGVKNIDILDIPSNEKYDLIVSISTFEHIGWDETPKNPRKVIEAFEKLTELLNKKGLAIITIPVGYNSFLDEYLNKINFLSTEVKYLKRVGKLRWVEVEYSTAIKCEYGAPFKYANCVAIIYIKNDK